MAHIVSHTILPLGRHYSIGITEGIIQDLCNILTCLLAEGNIPPKYWDVVGQHATLINFMACPLMNHPDITRSFVTLISNPDITTFQDLCGSEVFLSRSQSSHEVLHTVRHREMGTGISEPSKGVLIFLFATQRSKQGSSYFRQRSWVQAREAQIRFPAG